MSERESCSCGFSPCECRLAKASYRTRLRRLCAGINRLLHDVQADHPKAELYLDGSFNLCLMSGPAHDENYHGRQDRILTSAELESDGGDW